MSEILPFTLRRFPRLFTAVLLISHMAAYSMTFAGTNWQEAAPESQNVDSTKLRKAMNDLAAISGSQETGQSLVIRNCIGKVVAAVGPAQVQDEPADPIQVNTENLRWLSYKSGKPFFMAGPGDPEDLLYRGTRNADGRRTGDQMDIINKLENTGANCIYLQAVRSHGGDGDSTHNPFVDSDPAKGMDEDILGQWETWFAEMDRNGIVIFLFIYDDSARIWNTGDVVGPDEAAFIDHLVDTFEHHSNLIWCIAEEYSESYSRKRVSDIASHIRAADDFNHPIAVHQLNGVSFDFPDDPNIDQFAIQYNKSTAGEIHTGIVRAWQNANGRYNLNMSEAADHGTGATMRQKSWAAALGGAYVMVLGMDIANTPVRDLEDMGRLRRFMESTDFVNMAPHDELAFADTQYVLAQPGESYIAYSANANGSMGLRNLTAGTYNFRWLDTATGTEITDENVTVSSGDRSWPKPAPLGSEVAVFIVRTGDVSPPADVTAPSAPINLKVIPLSGS